MDELEEQTIQTWKGNVSFLLGLWRHNDLVHYVVSEETVASVKCSLVQIDPSER